MNRARVAFVIGFNVNDDDDDTNCSGDDDVGFVALLIVMFVWMCDRSRSSLWPKTHEFDGTTEIPETPLQQQLFDVILDVIFTHEVGTCFHSQ